MIRIAIGSDHAGFRRKQGLRDLLVKLGYKVVDLGCHDEERCDYPDYARRVAESVAKGRADKGVLVCGTGIGMAMAANKIPGIRAAVCWSLFTARMAAEHNWANVLCVPGRVLSDPQVHRILKTWLSSHPQGGRHKRRIEKIMKLDARKCLP
jgi:ribose 5-phosphate isomerase B